MLLHKKLATQCQYIIECLY